MADLQRTMRLATVLLAASVTIPAHTQTTGQGQLAFAVVPKHVGDAAQPISQKDVDLKINGKDANVTGLIAPGGPNAPVEAVMLIDGGSRNLVGNRLEEIASFIKSLPPDLKFTLGYLQNGRAYLTGPMTTDRAVNLHGLLAPGGAPNSNGGIYSCLSDIARKWPSRDPKARRELILIADGQDLLKPDQRITEKFGSTTGNPSNGITNQVPNFDPSDLNVERAIADAVAARLVVSAIAWRSQTLSENDTNTGQSLLQIVTDATGGKNFWSGASNPPTLMPYFDDFVRRSQNQYILTFTAPLKDKPEVDSMRLKVKASGSEVDAPLRVLVAPAGK